MGGGFLLDEETDGMTLKRCRILETLPTVSYFQALSEPAKAARKAKHIIVRNTEYRTLYSYLFMVTPDRKRK